MSFFKDLKEDIAQSVNELTESLDEETEAVTEESVLKETIEDYESTGEALDQLPEGEDAMAVLDGLTNEFEKAVEQEMNLLPRLCQSRSVVAANGSCTDDSVSHSDAKLRIYFYVRKNFVEILPYFVGAASMWSDV